MTMRYLRHKNGQRFNNTVPFGVGFDHNATCLHVHLPPEINYAPLLEFPQTPHFLAEKDGPIPGGGGLGPVNVYAPLLETTVWF